MRVERSSYGAKRRRVLSSEEVRKQEPSGDLRWERSRSWIWNREKGSGRYRRRVRVPFNGLEEIVRVGRSDELAVEMVGSVRRDIETKNGEGIFFVAVAAVTVGVDYIGFRFKHLWLFFSHRYCHNHAAGARSFHYKRQKLTPSRLQHFVFVYFFFKFWA